MAKKESPAVELVCTILMLLFLILAGLGCLLSGSHLGLTSALKGTFCKVLLTSVVEGSCSTPCFQVDVQLGWDCKQEEEGENDCLAAWRRNATEIEHATREDAESKAQEQFPNESTLDCIVPDSAENGGWDWLREPVRVLGIVTLVFTGLLTLGLAMDHLEAMDGAARDSGEQGGGRRPSSGGFNVVKSTI